MSLIKESLEGMGITCKIAPHADSREGPLRLRVGGFDRRKMMFKGWVEVESFSRTGHEGSFCVMQRDVVWVLIPLSFQLIYFFLYQNLRATLYLGGNFGKRW